MDPSFLLFSKNDFKLKPKKKKKPNSVQAI